MTTRQAIVTEISIYDDEFSMNPYVETVSLEPINCTCKEIYDWLPTAAMTRDDLGMRCGSDGVQMCYVDEKSPYAVGDIISISFEDHIVNSINRSGLHAMAQINKMTHEAMSRI
jgi:hypothetical protein